MKARFTFPDAITFILLVAFFIVSSCEKDSDKNGETVKDISGNVYNTVKIGTQTWMVENLKTTKYNDGTSILKITNNAKWTNATSGGYCWYDNDSLGSGNTYGALYNWQAVHSDKLAPTGWRVATDDDWLTLTNFLNGDTAAGAKLKESGTVHWQFPNTGATDEAGFTALPGGYRNKNGTFDDIGVSGDWWTATQTSASSAWFRGMSNTSRKISRTAFEKNYGFSVRCVR
jgi:uncharacterized protein (TIGR02145 family)